MRFALDLLPEGKKKVRLPKAWIALIVILTISLAAHLSYKMATHVNPMDRLMSESAALETEKAAIMSQIEGISAGGDIALAVRRVKFLNKLSAYRRFDPLALFGVIESSVPEGAWCDEIIFRAGGITLSGGATNLDIIYAMNSKILDSTIFEGVKMTHSAENFESLGYLTFNFSMALKKE